MTRETSFAFPYPIFLSHFPQHFLSHFRAECGTRLPNPSAHRRPLPLRRRHRRRRVEPGHAGVVVHLGAPLRVALQHHGGGGSERDQRLKQ